jgi:hypothetical protein
MSVAAHEAIHHKFRFDESGILRWCPESSIRVIRSRLLPANIPPLNVPNPAWAGPEDKIKEALEDSGKRTLLGHG